MNREKRQFTFKAGWPGYVLSAAIVAGRAYSSPVPMENWSCWSWALMLAPAFFPLYFFVAWYAIYACGALALFLYRIASWLFSGIFGKGGRN